MSILDYNFRNILVLSASIIGVSYFVYYLFNKYNKIKIKWFNKSVVKKIYVCMTLFICVIFIFGFAESKTESVEGKVVSITRMGSIGDFWVNYTVFIIDKNGNEISYNSPIISSKEYINKLDTIKEGDRVTIYYGKKLHYMIDVVT